MKIILEISDCSKCPYCKYKDQYDSWREEDFGKNSIKEGFYCNKNNDMFLTDYYNNKIMNGINIPDNCPFLVENKVFEK